ncbi:MAG: DUF87 domain-containing protein [Planctomycetaceae bacterium]|jgi:energy-coupling factor transporter ATP-binding protein EcfA2|nr:DUF87 domain-containing protein [Planctomycetaceae bacterium]
MIHRDGGCGGCLVLCVIVWVLYSYGSQILSFFGNYSSALVFGVIGLIVVFVLYAIISDVNTAKMKKAKKQKKDSEIEALHLEFEDYRKAKIAEYGSGKLQAEHDEQLRVLESERSKKLAVVQEQRQDADKKFAEQKRDIIEALNEICKEARSIQPPLNELSRNHLNVSDDIPEMLSMGTLDLTNTGVKTPNLLPFPLQYLLYDDDNEGNISLVRQFLLRLLFSLPAGMLQITVFDPLKFGTSLEPFNSLLDIKEIVPDGIWLTQEDEIENVIQNLNKHIANVKQKNFRNGITNWQQYNAANKEHPLPYHVLFILGFPAQISEKSIERLNLLLQNGPQCGVLPIVTINYQQLAQNKKAEEITAWLGEHAKKMRNVHLPKLSALNITDLYAPFPTHEQLSEYFQWIHAEYGKLGEKTADIDELWETQDLWTQTSADGVSVPLGKSDDGKNVNLEIGDAAAHYLIAGGTGSGKSNLIHVILHGLAHRYSPDELNIYLLDCKGVEYGDYAERKDGSGKTIPSLPHIRLVTLDVDTEYCVTVLSHLVDEMKRRTKLFKNFKDYRKQEHLPRILLFMDEFQVVLQADYETAGKAQDLFNELLRQGRSAGIHILCATQTLTGLNKKINFEELKRNLVGRIALSCDAAESIAILASNNEAAAKLKKEKNLREGILNISSGEPSANRKFVIPYARQEKCIEHQNFLAKKSAGTPKDIRIFSGSYLPPLPLLQWFKDTKKNPSQIVLGEEFNFESAPFAFDWKAKRRKNLVIAGSDEIIRNGLLHSLLLSADGHFDRIIYFNTINPRFTLDVSVANLEVKPNDWDSNIPDIIADFKERKILFIIDALEEAEAFFPEQAYPKTPDDTPPKLFRQFLENAPQYGSFVVAFAENWPRFRKQCKDYLGLFELRIGFGLNTTDAGYLLDDNGSQFKGLDNCNKAVFVDGNQRVLFRPFIVPTDGNG